MSKELLNALDILQEEKGISPEVVVDALETALITAYKRNYQQAQNVEVVFDEKKGNFKIFAIKEVVDMVLDSQLEVSLEDAHKINPAYEIGDTIKFEVTPSDFGRIAAQTAKQVVMQRVREAERSIIYEEFIDYEDDLLSGVVERQDRRYVYVNLGKIEAVLTPEGQIPGETFQAHDRIQVYIERVENTTKGPQIYVSRSHPNLLKRLFEQEVPEIYDGTVEIKSIAREAGDRSKVAVYSNDPNIDPVGTCVGPRGQRVQAVVNELKNENMDIIEWNEDPAVFISNALNPAEVLDVHFVPNEKSCIVVVPDNHLSLAIGKRGQNARLAAKLTNHKIDIKSESDFAEYQLTDEYQDLFFPAEDLKEESAEDAANVAEDVPEESLVDVADEVEAIEDASENEVEAMLDNEDISEGNYDPEDVEDVIDEFDNDSEQSYDDLVAAYDNPDLDKDID
ncbi:transcription termination factor NusA [Aerococcus suis]|uniref:Transcription termination/antitermination protein NusA n=1 Tax=Aerococcus suis TaxID=371602 RepID=A0A1W1Y7W0_9LACT|nr:transcription termination factor NusA [Aerococcus suis]MCI7240850.1 transcription termination factor NusA [Aerococcus suis]MDD7758420.1 transcription termination factor NusA [Aerococcus suis]SMC32215.1 NusA antitermination factor [Aerococcus suis]